MVVEDLAPELLGFTDRQGTVSETQKWLPGGVNAQFRTKDARQRLEEEGQEPSKV